MVSEGTHEPVGLLSENILDEHRAYRSLIEEFDAVDWYAQRIEATADSELAAILAHNRDEEKEHAAMLLEWLRRRDKGWDEKLRLYLFSDRAVLEIESLDESAKIEPKADVVSGLGIGSLKGIGRGMPRAR